MYLFLLYQRYIYIPRTYVDFLHVTAFASTTHRVGDAARNQPLGLTMETSQQQMSRRLKIDTVAT